jgi:ABC-type phosphate/phosphonate transport system substrate-binding protein
MYDFPGLQKHNDVFWSAVAHRLVDAGITDVPANLERSDKRLLDLWQAPDLLFGQTCGYPLMALLRDRVQLVATPKYAAAGCQGAYHRSVIVVRQFDKADELKDLRGRRCAINESYSNSGMNLLRGKISRISNGAIFFSSVITTESHLTSLKSVVENLADVASIDCVTWAHVKRYYPELYEALRVIDWTEESPGLPFVTAKGTDGETIEAIRAALFSILEDDALGETRAALLLEGFEVLPLHAYQRITDIEQEAIALGYPQLK